MPTQSQRQSLVTVDGIDGYWAQRTGGEGDTPFTKVYNGGDLNPELLAGPTTYTDVVLTRPYDRVRDGQYKAFLLAAQGSWQTTIAEVDTDANLIPQATGVSWVGKLSHVKWPETNSSSGAAAEIALTFAIQSAS